MTSACIPISVSIGRASLPCDDINQTTTTDLSYNQISEGFPGCRSDSASTETGVAPPQTDEMGTG
jgi:hypothetical protein